MANTNITRVCKTCGEIKTLDQYGRVPGNPNKKKVTCKKCVQIKKKEWRENNILKNKDLPPLDGKHICRKCNIEKDAKQFLIMTRNKYGIDKTCGDCRRRLNRERYVRDIDRRKEQAKWGALKFSYGLTKQEWLNLLQDQEMRCAICKIELVIGQRSAKNAACVDHDHETKKVRGLVCRRCNQGIGLLQDSSMIAEAAAVYLRKHGK